MRPWSLRVSWWYEPIDRQPGATPLVQASPGQITYDMKVVGVRARPPRQRPARLVIQCSDDGTITVRLPTEP